MANDIVYDGLKVQCFPCLFLEYPHPRPQFFPPDHLKDAGHCFLTDHSVDVFESHECRAYEVGSNDCIIDRAMEFNQI